jgi:hypothetical protein
LCWRVRPEHKEGIQLLPLRLHFGKGDRICWGAYQAEDAARDIIDRRFHFPPNQDERKIYPNDQAHKDSFRLPELPI